MKKTVKKLMSAFLALIMILSVGAMPAFATENDDAMTLNQTEEDVTTFSSDDWIKVPDNRYETHAGFSREVYTRGLIFSGSSDMSICVAMSGISNSGLGTTYFTVQLVRLHENGTYDNLHTFRLNGNSKNTTLSWGNVGAGAYQVIFKKDSTNLAWFQTISSISIIGG